MMNRKLLKSTAMKYIKTAKPAPLLVGIVALAVKEILSYLSYQVTNMGKMQQAMLDFYENGDTQAYLDMIAQYSPSFIGTLLDVFLQLMGIMITTGIMIFVIRTVREGKGNYGNLLDGLPVLFRVVCLYLVEGIFIFLWSMLLVIPGIIAAIRYSQAIYLLLDHPEMGIMECIRGSKQMMEGRKGEYFIMQLSFFGWALLQYALSMALGYSGLPLLVTEILLIPYAALFTVYQEFTYFLYYEGLYGVEHDPDTLRIEERKE